MESIYPDRPRRPIKLNPEPNTSRSLEYGVRLLACFTAEHPAWQVSELAAALGLGRSTTHRYAKTLVALGYLEQDKQSRYRLAVRAGEPGRAIVGTLRVEAPAARTILEDLREETGHTVSLAALDGTYALYLQRLYAHGPGQFEADLQQGVGARVPLFCTAIGKALLMSLDETEQRAAISLTTLEREGPNTVKTKRALAEQVELARELGFAVCDEEQDLGVRSIAAPVRHPGRSRPLAVAVTVPARLYTVEEMVERFGGAVRGAAKRV
ncbi:MAG: IclR family transcriptional regulator [Solirubrobacteraceae bacterium]